MSIKNKEKKILVAPLNWGLGHATRCIPLIRTLQQQGVTVILASDGAALALLRREFPELECQILPPYNIRYPFNSMILSMAVQMPKILRGCFGEYFWLKRFLKTNQIDAVISDNRFGFFSKKIKSVFITHQVQIPMPSPILQPFVDAVNHFFISRFDELWIPDFENKDFNLAGKLAHYQNNTEGVIQSQPISKNTFLLSKKLKIKYLGALSRMKKCETVKKYDAAFILSGPEPQRSFLEKKIWEELTKVHNLRKILNLPKIGNLGKIPPQYLLVRGTTEPLNFDNFDKNILEKTEIHDLLTTETLNQKMCESQLIICRSGYSSLMDLWALSLSAVLIPTDGQTEQEYLAKKLQSENRFQSIKQADFDLEKALNSTKDYKGFTDFPNSSQTLAQIIREFLIF